MNFSFVIPECLAGMERPGTYADFDADMNLLVNRGIASVVSLTPRPLDPNELSLHNLRGLHLPVEDFHAPTQDQIDRFVQFVKSNKPVVVHCGVGLGRTGTMLACYLVYDGSTAADAIRKVRNCRPGSIETPQQEKAIHEYARRIGMGGASNV